MKDAKKQTDGFNQTNRSENMSAKRKPNAAFMKPDHPNEKLAAVVGAKPDFLKPCERGRLVSAAARPL